MKTYTIEQNDPGVGTRARTVEADGYTWAQGGVVSVARLKDAEKPADGDGSVREMETFATFFHVTGIFEADTVR